MRKSAPHPRSRKTPTGGKMMAKMILMMSLFGVYRQPSVVAKLNDAALFRPAIAFAARGEAETTYLPVKGIVADEC